MYSPFWGFDPFASTVTANQASRRADDAQYKAESAEQKLARLSLITEALWGLLKTKLGCTDEELRDEITRVDLMDGKLDGRKTPTLAECGKCQRPNAPGRERCIYCGQPIGGGDPFARV